MADERKLRSLISVGRLRQPLRLLGIKSVAGLAKHDPQALYDRLCRKTGTRQDPCVLDTFCAAIAQARDPKLPLEKCKWWYRSGVRKKKARSS
jgi:hypothetical protein